MSEETTVGRAIRARLNTMPGVRIWRNNTGFASKEKVVYGLATGSADYIGMIDGMFFSLEVKTHRKGSKLQPDQVLWAETVNRLGGFAACARDEDEAEAIVWEARGAFAARGGAP
jgi:hypothetical protein